MLIETLDSICLFVVVRQLVFDVQIWLSVVALRTASNMTALTLDGKAYLAAPITGMWVWCVPPIPGTLIQSDSMVGATNTGDLCQQ